ncbi:50S ribosomal protein L29 [Texas Phoenix palm phytoplasma]|uniref:Large ribosomal subunit protein uL29 n=1 Tax=Texas Phoenix palm phytoplasma TaxID=176709 RepID=A0ABS5BJ67_9MOLU|nr:50S ribosomal protein L29 [Texas Phoenix palm phytoplasma]MBP3059411.1 50S ribosomal protein L29 [Texas Phoenix palm phytoplasma]
MNIKEIQKMTLSELEKKILFLKKELFHVKLKIDLSQAKDTSLIRKIRKNIARIKTVINQKSNKE